MSQNALFTDNLSAEMEGSAAEESVIVTTDFCEDVMKEDVKEDVEEAVKDVIKNVIMEDVQHNLFIHLQCARNEEKYFVNKMQKKTSKK